MNDIKTHILDTAEKLFNQAGYSAVGVDLIRDTAGVSKTTIYRHFPGKQSIIAAVLRRRDAFFRSGLSTAVASAITPSDKIQALFDWHYDWFKSSTFCGCMFMHGLPEFRTHSQELQQIATEHKAWILALINEILTETKYNQQQANLFMALLEGSIVNAEFFGFIRPDPEIARLINQIG